VKASPDPKLDRPGSGDSDGGTRIQTARPGSDGETATDRAGTVDSTHQAGARPDEPQRGARRETEPPELAAFTRAARWHPAAALISARSGLADSKTQPRASRSNAPERPQHAGATSDSEWSPGQRRPDRRDSDQTGEGRAKHAAGTRELEEGTNLVETTSSLLELHQIPATADRAPTAWSARAGAAGSCGADRRSAGARFEFAGGAADATQEPLGEGPEGMPRSATPKSGVPADANPELGRARFTCNHRNRDVLFYFARYSEHLDQF
jgi:hypothetical protein